MHSSALSHCQYTANIHWVWRNRLVLLLAYTERDRCRQRPSKEQRLGLCPSVTDERAWVVTSATHSHISCQPETFLDSSASPSVCLTFLFFFFKPTFWSNIQAKHRHTVSISVNKWLDDLQKKSKLLYIRILFFNYLFILSNSWKSTICFCFLFQNQDSQMKRTKQNIEL